jgi:hypothetical protein
MPFRVLPIALVAYVLMGAAAHAAQAPDAPPDAALQARIEAAPRLDDVRTGISTSEPEYCSASLVRSVNPNAANRSGIEAGPPKFLVEGLTAGSTWRHCVSIHNRSPEVRAVRIELLDITGSLDPNVRVETRPQPISVGSWITPLVTELVLEPGERVLVPYLLEVPTTPPGGTVAGGISVQDTMGSDLAGAGTRITRAVILQLQVTFPGGRAAPLQVEVERSTRFVWTGRDPDRAAATYTVSNVGEVVDLASPRLLVGGLFGRRVASVTAFPEVIIPQSALQYRTVWTNLPWIGVYRPTLEVKSGVDTQRIELPRVWVAPPWPVLLGFVLAVLLAVWGIVRRRQEWRAYLDEEDGDDEYAQYDQYEPHEQPVEYEEHDPRY